MSRKRIVVVTGGGSGIGRATAKRFGKDGDLVVVADINTESARAVAGEIAAAGGEATPFTVDVARESEVGAFAAALEEEHGVADVLVTCAGLLQNVHVHPQHGHRRARPDLGCQLPGRLPLLPGLRPPHGRARAGVHRQHLVDLGNRGLSLARLRPRQGGYRPPDRDSRLGPRSKRRTRQRGRPRLRADRADAGSHRRRLSGQGCDAVAERARAHRASGRGRRTASIS